MVDVPTFTGGRCAGLTSEQFDYFMASKESAQRLCDGCPLQARCLSYLMSSHEQFSRQGGLSPRERQYLAKLMVDDGLSGEPSEDELSSWLASHPHALAQARELTCEYLRRYRRSNRHRQYVREYAAGKRTIVSVARKELREHHGLK